MPEWTHRVTISRPLPSEGKKAQIKIEAGLHHLQGNKTPYFSVTGEVLEYGHVRAAGCIHDQILEAAPELAPVIALHLSDHRGYPMHLVANGLYHLGFGKFGKLNLDHVASHFRITRQQAEELREMLISGDGYDRDQFAAFLSWHRPRWKKEAREGIELLDHLDRAQLALEARTC